VRVRASGIEPFDFLIRSGMVREQTSAVVAAGARAEVDDPVGTRHDRLVCSMTMSDLPESKGPRRPRSRAARPSAVSPPTALATIDASTTVTTPGARLPVMECLRLGAVADGPHRDRFDLAGAAICLIGVAVVMWAPR
jgi:hypothetical protein